MEYLKVTDIMVGDIVRYADQDKPQIATIDTLHAIKEGAEVVGVPLTVPTLESFGFDVSDGEVMQYNFKEDGEMYHFSLRQMYNKDGKPDGFSFYAFNVLSIVLCVHELQHALRVVGLKYDFKPCLQ